MNFPILTPPWSALGKRIESTIRKALYTYQMIEEKNDIAIALSGGKDSLTLLYMLKAISGKGFPPFKIHAIHIKGEFSCGAGVQENFLRHTCHELGINFITAESTQKLETLECYRCSRERRALIFEAAKNVGATTIAFGHHKDDHAQTLLMNLLHKGEFAGNLPKIEMYDYGVTIIRPLIFVREKDIRHFAQQNGYARIMCRCPVGQDSMRKKMDQLLTEMESFFPNARENIARAGLLYGSDKAGKR